MKRGETKTFSYKSTTSTDQEVIIYHAQYIKALDNLSNLNPSSCILANARKLTNVEIHSNELYNINVTNNTFLRTINLEGCSTLGTVTATGSSLDLSNCKYLKYCNVYNTALTEVQLNTSGGSLVEILYPKTIQSINLIKQRLLEKIGLPYGSNGEEIPTSLYTISIQECPNIKYLNTSKNSAINTTFASMVYCNNLTIRNSLDLKRLTFDGFYRLKNVVIENMYNLAELGFNDLLPKGNASTVQYIGLSNCPLLEVLELNCTSDEYEITFANKAILNLGGLFGLKSIQSNCVLKGIETIVVPLNLESMFFTNEYGEGYSTIKNIWSSSVCTVNTAGATAKAQHVIPTYEGIDFAGMNLKNIDLGALVNIPKAINFTLYPTSVNPHFNLNRDGETYPYLQPEGTLDLSNYTESLAKFFDGVDLRKLQIVCSNPLPQKDLSYCFYNSTFDKDSQVSAVLNNIDTVNNMEYCFYKTSVKDVSILNSINFLAGTSLAYCFAECPNISKLENITLSGNIGNASYMFSGSGISTIKNVSTSCGNIIGMFSNCNNLVTVTNFDANGTTSYESLFEGCSGMSVAPVTEIPGTIINIKNMYKDCLGLVSIDNFVLHGNITEATGFVEGCNNLINANNVTISGSFYNDIFRGLTSLKYVNNLLINYVGRSMTFANMFDGCTNLIEMSFHPDSYVKDVISMDYMFRGTSMRTVDFSNVNFEKIVSYKYMFADCLMEEFSFTVPKTITSIQGMLSNCRNLKTLRNFNISHNVTVTDWLLDTPVENLIACSFYNQNTAFNNNATLKKIEGFKYTGNNLSGYFDGCTNLKTAELTIGNVVTKANNLFANCPLLTSVEFNSESDLSNVTTISDMFNGDTSLSTIRNLKITKSSTLANNTTLSGCPINNTDGFYINSNSAVDMFRLGAESKITQFTDFEIGSSCNNLSNAFKDYPLLIKDILLPSHMVNVSYAFSNCIAMENIVSNWTNSYDRNNDDDLSNDVITEGCYEGSNNIKYIDNELYMNEYGELTAMQYIPPEWGGNASYEDNQTVFDVKITDDNLIYSLVGNVGDNKTNWGDGTEDMNISHEYSKPGTYTIITENILTFAQGTVVDTSISSPIVKFRALNKSLTNGSHLFDGWTNLLQVNKLTNTFNSYDYMFNNCSRLTNVDLSGCTLSQTVTSMAYMFNNCERFTINPINIIPDSVTNITNLYKGTNITDLSGMTFGKGIISYSNWIPPKLENIRNVTMKINNRLFQGITSLKYIEGFNRPNSGDWSNYFEGCTSLLEDILFPSNTSDCSNCFNGCSSLLKAHSNWDNISPTSTDCYAGCTGIEYFDGEYILGYDGDQGLDYIPRAWGGYGFIMSQTSIFEIEIPNDGYQFRPVYYYYNLTRPFNIAGNNIIKWGDGTYWSNEAKNLGNVALPLHTYEKAGTYYVKGNYITRFYNNADEICNTAVKCHRLAYDKDRSSMLRGMSKLTYVNWDAIDMTGVNNCQYVFQGCSSLPQEYIKVSENWDMSNVKYLSDMYNGCTLLTDLDLSNWNTSQFQNINALIANTNISNIEWISNWDVSNLTSANDVFKGTKITDFTPINNWNVPKLTTVQGMFSGNNVLKTITLPDWFKNPTITNIGSLFTSCSNLKEVHNFDWGGHITLSGSYNVYPRSVFQSCSTLTTIEDVNMDYTSILGTQHGGNAITNDYWRGLAWNIFSWVSNLQNINFTGTVTLYDSVKELRFFLDCDVSKFTLNTWQSFVNTLPITTGAYTIKVNKGLATIPDTIVSQITEKGYTLTA